MPHSSQRVSASCSRPGREEAGSLSGDRGVVLGETPPLSGLPGPEAWQLGLWGKTPQDWGHPIQCSWGRSLGIAYYHSSPDVPGSRHGAKAQKPLQQSIPDGRDVSDNRFSQPPHVWPNVLVQPPTFPSISHLSHP